MAHPLYFVIFALSLLLAPYITFTWYAQYYLASLSPAPANGSEFDFIVVGSGSTGSVVAGRLAEAGHSVLLVEAGGPSHWIQGLPAFVPWFSNTIYDWNYKTVPQKGAGWMLDHHQVSWPRGKELGGSSMLNWMLYVRGHSKDYDEWEAMGNPGWGYKDVLPYFKKSENFQGMVENKDRYHGTQGPVSVRPMPYTPTMNKIHLEAMEELGYPIGDVNGETEDEGFFEHVQMTVKDGWRLGTYRSYIEPFLNKLNITVLTFSLASKVTFQDKKATGVEIKRFGETLNYRAKKEVIISAGAIGSPQILMLSGIGPKEHLLDLEIDLVEDLPVGNNLQDHIMVLYTHFTEHPGLTTSRTALMNPLDFYKLFKYGSGPLSDNGLGTNGMLHSPSNTFHPRPNLQFHMSPFGLGIDFGIVLQPMLGVNKTAYDSLQNNNEYFYDSMILPTLLHPKSAGTIRLASKDINDHPIIDPQYLVHPEDRRTLIEGMKVANAVQNTKAYQKHGIRAADPDTHHCGEHKAYTDDYWDCFIRHWTTTVFHPAGTCKMGPVGSKDNVVDSSLRVKGIQGLRVMDASIMPNVVGANTNAACIMIGEKGADLVLQDWPEADGASMHKRTKEEL